MKPVTFTSSVEGRHFFDFVPLYSKQDFNDAVSSIQAKLKLNGVNCKTSSLKEWLAHAAGYNSAAHLTSSLPLAFCGMECLYNLNIMLNEKTQWSVLFEALNLQKFNFEEFKYDPLDYKKQAKKQAKKKVARSDYKVIKIDYNPSSFFDHWHHTHDADWDCYFRASAFVELFPSYRKADPFIIVTPESMDYFDTAFYCAAIKKKESSLRDLDLSLDLDSLLAVIECEDFLLSSVYEADVDVLNLISSYARSLADERGMGVVEGRELKTLQEPSRSGFARWLSRQVGRDDIVSDFARDAKHDPNFKKHATSYREIMLYLEGLGVNDHVVSAAIDAWHEFSCS
jgi:uncharacterized protein YozE (UPF0346 family)